MPKKILYHLRRSLYWVLASLDRFMELENQAVILVFHSIDEGEWFFGNTKDQVTSYLNKLSRYYQFVSLSELVAIVQNKSKLPKKVLAVTFDDGYKNILTLVPVLQKFGIRPTVFAISQPRRVDRNELETKLPLLSEQDLKNLHRKYGWELGCHTATHADLSALDSYDLVKQILDARKDLIKNTQAKIEFFAYPKGKYNDKVVECVAKAGFKAAFTMDSSQLSLANDLLLLPRIGVNRTHTRSELLNSLSPSVLMVKRFISKNFANFKVW